MVAAFEALGIERGLLPQRVYWGALGGLRPWPSRVGRRSHDWPSRRNPSPAILRASTRGLWGSRGRSPSSAPPGTREVWPRGVCWLPAKTGREPALADGPLEAVAEGTGRTIPEGEVRGAGADHVGGMERKARRNPDGENSVQGRGCLRPEAGAFGRRAGGQGMFADAPGTRAYAAPRCENDTGGRFTNRPSGASRRAFRPSACAGVSCGHAAGPSVAGLAAPAVAGATPLSEGLVRHSAERVFTPSAPAFQGSLPNQLSLAGRRCERRFEAAEDPLADRLAGGLSGIADQDRDAPDWPAVWPSRTGSLAGRDPAAEGRMACPSPSSPMPIEACRDGGSLPSTSKERGSASGLRWPWRNLRRASDLHDRGRVRPNGDFVSGHPQSEPDTQGSAPGAPKTASESWPCARTSTRSGTAAGPIAAVAVSGRIPPPRA